MAAFLDLDILSCLDRSIPNDALQASNFVAVGPSQDAQAMSARRKVSVRSLSLSFE
ncbi:MAG: hypothetical protein FWD55_02475 [Propionibacteriaceae bacterium]|nr:hypothetical protein [Propionibacteriaceae bacterium]